MTNKKVKDDVLKYMVAQNRPYSANDVSAHFGKDLPKSAIQKALDELVEEEWVIEKAYGKQKVYAPKQYDDSAGGNLDSVIFQLDTELNEITAELTKSEQDLKNVENEIKSLENQLSTEEALKKEKELEDNVLKLEEKLKLLTEKGVKISADDKKKVTKQNEVVVKEYKKRKRICMDIANAILENYPKPKKAFFEEVGIALDEN